MGTSDSELKLLESLYSSQNEAESPTQREFAVTTGLSLGMVNAMLARFAERGWITLTQLSGRKIKYALTPDGVNEVLRRSVRYLRTTVKSAMLYQKRVHDYVRALAEKGYENLFFDGPDEIGYLFKYECESFGIEFIELEDEVPLPKDLISRNRGKSVIVSGRDREASAAEVTVDAVEIERVWLSDILLSDVNVMEYTDGKDKN